MQSTSTKVSVHLQDSNHQNINILVRVVLNSLPSPLSKRVYKMGIRDFLEYWRVCEEPVLDKLFLQTYIANMQDEGVGEASINIRLAAIRKLAREASELQIWPDTVTSAFSSVKNIPQRGKRTGNWLSLDQAQQLISAPDISTHIGLRDQALLATLLGCGIRRTELITLTIQQLTSRSVFNKSGLIFPPPKILSTLLQFYPSAQWSIRQSASPTLMLLKRRALHFFNTTLNTLSNRKKWNSNSLTGSKNSNKYSISGFPL
ncbi:MAG: hypothetical protein FVQ83_08550 [Chloroflexi bacterium]|nr:hypothetical protein [Chloroflexota bacterium]